MKARVKVGVIIGSISLVVNIFISTLLGLCGPGVSLIAGALAGFLAARQEKPSEKSEGAKLGAIAGLIAGLLTLVGQIIGAAGALAFFQVTGARLPFGGRLPTNASELVAYYLVGMATGACFGLVGAVLAALAGAGTGFLGTPDIVQGHPTEMRPQ